MPSIERRVALLLAVVADCRAVSCDAVAPAARAAAALERARRGPRRQRPRTVRGNGKPSWKSSTGVTVS